MKNIVLVSNPFGFGPVGKLHSIATEFLSLVKQGKISLTFIGGEKSWDIMKNDNIRWLKVDERSEEELSEILGAMDNPYIVSSQNRFVIKVAKRLGLPCAFLDGLAWFWDEIPSDHLLADIIFWIKYPDITKKTPAKDNIQLVSGISLVLPDQIKNPEKNLTIIHLGGGANPLTKTLPFDWLDILISAIGKVEEKRLLVCGGEELIKYFQKFIPFKQINSVTLNHQDFLSVLTKAKRLVTTGGQSATVEAMAMGIPVAFLPSYNLSQSALVEYLRAKGAAPLRFDWQDLGLAIPKGKEVDAINIYGSYAKKVKGDYWLLAESVDKIKSLIEDKIRDSGQKAFIKNLGNSGAKEIFSRLASLWSLD